MSAIKTFNALREPIDPNRGCWNCVYYDTSDNTCDENKNENCVGFIVLWTSDNPMAVEIRTRKDYLAEWVYNGSP